MSPILSQRSKRAAALSGSIRMKFSGLSKQYGQCDTDASKPFCLATTVSIVMREAAMSRLVLTEHKCRTLKPGERRRFLLDAPVPGLLVLSITPASSHRSFSCARWPGGSRHSRPTPSGRGRSVERRASAPAGARNWLTCWLKVSIRNVS